VVGWRYLIVAPNYRDSFLNKTILKCDFDRKLEMSGCRIQVSHYFILRSFEVGNFPKIRQIGIEKNS